MCGSALFCGSFIVRDRRKAMTEVATGRRTPSGVVTTATPLAVAVGMSTML